MRFNPAKQTNNRVEGRSLDSVQQEFIGDWLADSGSGVWTTRPGKRCEHCPLKMISDNQFNHPTSRPPDVLKVSLISWPPHPFTYLSNLLISPHPSPNLHHNHQSVSTSYSSSCQIVYVAVCFTSFSLLLGIGFNPYLFCCRLLYLVCFFVFF